jgi:3-isopropylmalate dehydratase
VTLEENVKEFGVTYFGMSDRRQGFFNLTYPLSRLLTRVNAGIVHIIGPEQGFTVRKLPTDPGFC